MSGPSAARAGRKTMKRAAMLIAVVLALGGATAGLLRGAAAPPPDEVATYTVARQGFVRRVTAEGNLRAVDRKSVV